MFSKESKLRQKNQLGFSLIEVLITSVIIGIVSAIIVVRYGAFNSSVLLKNQAYEIALSLREAQVFTISSRGQGNDFRDEYGVYFENLPAQDFVIFIDLDKDRIYDGGNELIEVVTLDSRFRISDLCLLTSGDTPDCSAGGITNLSVMFARPDFDAEFVASGNPQPFETRVQASVELSTTDGGPIIRNVLVSSAGQISVE